MLLKALCNTIGAGLHDFLELFGRQQCPGTSIAVVNVCCNGSVDGLLIAEVFKQSCPCTFRCRSLGITHSTIHVGHGFSAPIIRSRIVVTVSSEIVSLS